MNLNADVPPDSPHAWPDKADRVRGMFDRVARRYSRINTIVSLGLDAGWRRRAVAMADVQPGDRLLDCCCGPGEFADAFAAGSPAPSHIVGVDFSEPMLRMARARQRRRPRPIELRQADAMRLPFADASFELVSCAFGLRNLADAPAALAEWARVLAPGGRLVILEFAMPANRVARGFYQLYSRYALAAIGGLISGQWRAYRYLPRSVETFFAPARIVDMLDAGGLVDIRQRRLTLGVAVVTVARKPDSP